MAKDEVTDNIFSGRTSPRLTFVVGILLGVTLMTTVGIFFFTYVLSGGSVGTYEISPLAPSRSILEEPVGEVVLDGDTEIMIIDSNHVFGATSDYKVTLVQYLDYECLFCTKFFPEVQEFSADNSASIRYVIKHYPITRIHPHAKEAALASECAAEQGMLLEYSSSLYDHRTELNAKLYPVLAEELG
ncbi:MAG: thioredoxin domain-containing protein, partial [bacterium]|nr:thioredoxin domain-containing protein [bacterium]